jgi:ribosome-binding protein aMBF1 (putative translation factor)
MNLMSQLDKRGSLFTSYFCQLCGRSILGRFHLYHHPTWPEEQQLRVCGDCVEGAVRCTACQIPMVGQGEAGLCPTCAVAALHCLSCGRPITDQYAEVGGKGPYCESCLRERDRCDICGTPLGHTHQLLTDGRQICAQCHATAVYDQETASQLYRQAQQTIQERLGLSLNVPTYLFLVGRDQLVQIVRKRKKVRTEQVTSMLGIYSRQGMKRGIYVQSGLPRLLMMQVAAHEWGHAWQGENCPLLRDIVVIEGFAEWVSYKTLVALGAPRPEMMKMVQRPDVYGQGLRQALAVEKATGEAGVIEWCRLSRGTGPQVQT